MTPAAIAEPITPATFGPIACIRRKFWLSASNPILLETRAAIGTADTPAEPISGLILFLLNLFINFAINTPLPVPIPKAITPRIKMPNVCGCKNLSAISLDPTDKPSTMVTMLIKAFCVVSLKRSTTPLTRMRLPKQNIPSNGAASGRSKPTSNSKITGNKTFSRLLTCRICVMRILRSSSVVNAFIIGG